MFSAEESRPGIILSAGTPVSSVLVLVLELRRSRSGCIVPEAASVQTNVGPASRSRNLRHPADDSFDRTVAKAFRGIRNKVKFLEPGATEGQ